MKSKGLFIVVITFASVVLLAGCVPENGGSSASAEGKPAPDFTVVDLDGEEVSLSDLRGEPVILNFWASWCGACKEEMPYLQSIHDRYAESGVNVIALNVGEDAMVAKDFLDFNDLSLTVWLDKNKAVAGKYNIQGIPTTIFIDIDGIIVKNVVGAFPDEDAIAANIERYFK